MDGGWSELDLLIIQIDGIHIEEDLTLLAAIGIDGDGGKHPLGKLDLLIIQIDGIHIEGGGMPRWCCAGAAPHAGGR